MSKQIQLPRHTGYFRPCFREKYGVDPKKVTVVKNIDTGKTYTVYEIPRDTVLLQEDRHLIYHQSETMLRIAVRNYNASNIPPSRFSETGTLLAVTPYIPTEPPLINKKYIGGFKISYRQLFKQEPKKICIWRNLETGKTYTFFALPANVKIAPENVDLLEGQEGFLVRYQQMDHIPDSLFSAKGLKLNHSNVKEHGLTYAEIRRDTDDYRKESVKKKILSPEEIIERRRKNREYYRQRTGYYSRHLLKEDTPLIFIDNEITPHDRDLFRERDLELKDPLTDEEMEELKTLRKKLYDKK